MKRVQEKPRPDAEGTGGSRPDTQWTRPGLTARAKHLPGEEKLRHLDLLDHP